jgi:hypothetical protein
MLNGSDMARSGFRAAALAMFWSAVSGCMPWPHRERVTPFILGQLSDHGAFVTSSRVRLSRAAAESSDPCGPPFVETVTNTEGRFLFTPAREWRFVLPLFFADCAYDWQVCLKKDTSWRIVSRSHDFNGCTVGPPGIEYVSCRLNSSPSDQGPQCGSERDLVETQTKVEGWLTRR